MFNSKVKTNHVLKIFMNEKIIAKVVSTGGSSSRRTMHDFFATSTKWTNFFLHKILAKHRLATNILLSRERSRSM